MTESRRGGSGRRATEEEQRMLRRRRPSRANRDSHNSANRLAKAVKPLAERARYMIEWLEPRKYLLAVSGSGSFEYQDDGGDMVRVTYENITAEFVFIDVTEAMSNEGVRPLPEGYTRLTEPNFSDEGEGRDLFHIFIAESSHLSNLAIAQVPDPMTNNRPMQPYGGDISFRASHAQPGEDPIMVTVGRGGVLIGGLTHVPGENVEFLQERPIITHRFRGLPGVENNPLGPDESILGPKANLKLTAGITVAEGQSFGRMLIGGTIFGEVTIGGSIDLFYAGGLATGHADGEFEGNITNPDNFTVRGDLRNLVVGGNVGIAGLGLADDAVDVTVDYLSGFDLNVSGSIHQVRVEEVIGGSFDVHNSGSITKTRYRQRELERRSAGPPPGSQSF